MANPVEATGRIRIIKIPVGEWPKNIRAAFVGHTLPCLPILGYPSDGSMKIGVVSGAIQRNRYGFSVPQDQALEILSRRTPNVSLWLRVQGFPMKNQYFGFAEDEAEIISGVTRQNIVEVKDEDHGDPYR
jgi:hypothetical protein